jgi:hypothetical protein
MGEKNIIKRGFYFPEPLLKAWEEFHFPSKNYSPSASAAFFIYMLLPSDIREKARKAAYQDDIENAQRDFLKQIRQSDAPAETRLLQNALIARKIQPRQKPTNKSNRS